MSGTVLMLANLPRTVAGWADSVALLRSHGFSVDDPGGPLAVVEAARRAAVADALIVGGVHPLPAEVLEAAGRARIVSRQGVGTDNIDLAAATRLGIPVCNTAGCNSDAVADHAFGLLLSLTRDLRRVDALTRSGRGWGEGWPPTLTQLAGRTLGIVGTGNIGRAMARRAAGFGMSLLGHDLVPDPGLAERFGLRYLSLEEMLPLADVVTVHVPLTGLTRGLLGARELGLMKPGALLLNTARGGVVDEEALAEGVASGRLGGAGVDVFEVEPRTQSPLFGLERVILSPHLGGSSVESWTAARVWAAENVIGYFERGELRNVVNPEVRPRAVTH